MATPQALERLQFVPADTPAGLQISSLSWTANGFFAGGCRVSRDGICARAVILRSTDGRAWERATLEGPRNGDVRDIADTPLGLLALGAEFRGIDWPPGPRAWQSTDGTHWTRLAIDVPGDTTYSSIEVLRGAVLLFGQANPPDTFPWPVVARSRSGDRWQTGYAPESGSVRARPGLVAIGHPCIDTCPDPIPLDLQTSRDGMSWTSTDPGPEATGLRVSAAGALRLRLVAAGRDQPGRRSAIGIWRLDDVGLVPVGRLPGSKGVVATAFVSNGGQVIAFAAEDERSPVRAWASTDLERWTPLPVTGASGMIRVVAWSDGGGGPGTVIALSGGSILVAGP